MSESRKEIIKNTLVTFLSVRVDEDEIKNTIKHNNIGTALDEMDAEILSEAIDQALEKAKINESPNQFKQ